MGLPAMKSFALRLRPHQDLKAELIRFSKEQGLQAGIVLTCVGSLEKTTLRMAGQDRIQTWEEKMEILSLVGTHAADGVHLHLAVADGEGRTFGGHLVEGCSIYTTAEIALGDLDHLKFIRAVDPETGYKELEVAKRHGGK
jgi:predicted DNA-binding protein with PD1-like motif